MKNETAEALIAWYTDHKRDLPWRGKKNAYYTWISEVMLQQTRASAVIPYFERFIRILPDPAALASCPPETLMKLWQGLGYYSRARNLQAAAAVIVSDYDGIIPSSFEKLMTLPGIGRYTAGAIASIAYDQPVPAADGNVLRVAARLSGYEEDIRTPLFRKFAEKLVTGWMPEDQAGDFNQALMELGALVCVPNGPPQCSVCPLQEKCEANLRNLTASIPARRVRKEREIIRKTVFVIEDGKKHAIRKRPDTGLLAGLYELPNADGWLNKEEAAVWIRDLGLEPLHIETLKEHKHIFTHLEWRMKAYRILIGHSGEHESTGNLIFTGNGEEDLYAVPSAFREYLKETVTFKEQTAASDNPKGHE